MTNKTTTTSFAKKSIHLFWTILPFQFSRESTRKGIYRKRDQETNSPFIKTELIYQIGDTRPSINPISCNKKLEEGLSMWATIPLLESTANWHLHGHQNVYPVLPHVQMWLWATDWIQTVRRTIWHEHQVLLASMGVAGPYSEYVPAALGGVWWGRDRHRKRDGQSIGTDIYFCWRVMLLLQEMWCGVLSRTYLTCVSSCFVWKGAYCPLICVARVTAMKLNLLVLWMWWMPLGTGDNASETLDTFLTNEHTTRPVKVHTVLPYNMLLPWGLSCTLELPFSPRTWEAPGSCIVLQNLFFIW